MNAYIKNPKILLLKCSIEYLYREETKFTCIDPIVLQVRESIPVNRTSQRKQPVWFWFVVAFVFLKCFFLINSPSGTRVFEELRPAHRRRPSKPGVGGEDGVPHRPGHAAGARHHPGHQRQTGEFSNRATEVMFKPDLKICVDDAHLCEGF